MWRLIVIQEVAERCTQGLSTWITEFELICHIAFKLLVLSIIVCVHVISSLKKRRRRTLLDCRDSVLSTICRHQKPSELLFHVLWKNSVLFPCRDYQRVPSEVDHSGLQCRGSQMLAGFNLKLLQRWDSNEWLIICWGLALEIMTSQVTALYTKQANTNQRPARVLKGCKQTKREKWAKSILSNFFSHVLFSAMVTKRTVLVPRRGTFSYSVLLPTNETDPETGRIQLKKFKCNVVCIACLVFVSYKD